MTSVLRRAVYEIARVASRTDDAILFIRSEVAKMDRDQLGDLAVAYIYSEAQSMRRGVTLAAERAAEEPRRPRRSQRPRRGTQAWAVWADEPENAETLAAEYEIDERLRRELHVTLQDAMDKYAAELRIEWTAELLDAEFALGDGTSVSWGDASREQHELRMAMHRRNAIAGAEGFARHSQAIELLDNSGASSLREALSLLKVGTK